MTHLAEPICEACEARADGGFTCDPSRPRCPYEPMPDAWPFYEYVGRDDDAEEIA